MESKEETPRQMLGRALGTTHGSKSTRRVSGDGSSQISRSPASPHLDFVKRTQVLAQEQRVNARVRELMEGSANASKDHRTYDDCMEVPGASKDPVLPSDSVIPSTVIRRNITQRRSKGKSVDKGEMAPRSSLLLRKPRSRSKDRRYSFESTGGIADCERPDWRAASARFPPTTAGRDPKSEPSRPVNSRESGEDGGVQEESGDPRVNLANRVSSSTKEHAPLASSGSRRSYQLDSTAPFLRENIPPEGEHPELFRVLTQKWYERQEAVRGLGDALADDELERYEELKVMVDQINQDMHKEWRAVFRAGASETSAHRSHTPSGKFQAVDDLPLPRSSEDCDDSDSGSDESRYLEQDEWMETYRETEWNTLNQPPRKMSFKENNTGIFTVHLSFQGVTSPRIVNDNMPVKSLFGMALSYLQTEFKFVVNDINEIDLVYKDRILPQYGVLGGVPIMHNDVVVIMFPIQENGDYGKLSVVDKKRAQGTHSSPGPSGTGNTDSGNQMPSSTSSFSRQTPVPLSPTKGQVRDPETEDDIFQEFQNSSPGLDPRSYDKIRQSFKCPRFSGQAKDWKQWDKGFLRYLSIWELDYVLDPSFFDVLPLSTDKRRDNKLVYYVIEESVQGSTLASSYVRQVSLNNGFEAYYTLHDGYVFAGTTTAALLLNELSNFRFLPNETPTELCLRLSELFEELRTLPGDAAVTFIDTQQIGYLINALRHEKEWDTVCSTITSKQIQGNITFRQACDELRFRCETTRANEMMDRPVKGHKVKGLVTKPVESVKDDMNGVVEQVSEKLMGLISTMSKKHNQDSQGSKRQHGKSKLQKHECLAADCPETTIYPLCPLHYHSLVSAKVTTLKLRNGYGDATFDSNTNLISYPPRTPTSRLPTPKRQ